MFSLLVRRDGLIDPPEMNEVDAHCHILPGLDDGPRNDRGSLAIARLLLEMGVRTVVATPHVISDIYPLTTKQILDATEKFRALLSDSGLSLEVLPGAEYYIERQLLDRITKNDLLAWGDDRCVLFELPLNQEPLIVEDVIFNLMASGYTPVLAHAERYRFLQGNGERVQKLRRMGARFQVNHPSFHLPKTSRQGEMARWLYIKGLVDFLGTDMHRAAPMERFIAERNERRLLRRISDYKPS